MAFLSRLAARSRPYSSSTPLAMPKGMVARGPAPVFRQTSPEEEDEAAMTMRRRTAPQVRREEQEPEHDTAQRATTDVPDEKMPDDAVNRASDLTTEPESEEEPLAPLRRAAEEPQEEVAPWRAVRRQADEEQEEEEIQASRSIRRAEEVPFEEGEKPLRQPFQSDLEPGAMPAHPDLANEEEPSPLQALRRDIDQRAPMPTRTERRAPGPAFAPNARGLVAYETPDAPWQPATTREVASNSRDPTDAGSPTAPARERPQVVIDQIDVMIHETARPPAAAGRSFDMGRALRARYLRRL